MRMKHLTVVLALTLFTPLTSAAGPLQEDLAARRGKLMERLGPDTLAIFWSAPTRVYSGDVDYEYRQESNLLYLTGIDQPETILVLMPGNISRREILFIREADARREHWEGHSLTPAEATAQSGIQTVMTADRFDSFVAAMFSKRAMGGATGEYERFFAALADGRARLSMLLEPQVSLTAAPGPTRQFGANLKERFFGFAVLDATPLLWELRQVKTPYEQGVMRKSVAISSEAHKAGMREAAPGKFEYEVEAAIEHVYLRSGAMSWGYPSIVGSGPNATILHYNKSNRRMERGDLLLVDAAANYEGYTGDITRTYPVSGTFTPASARDLRDRAGGAGGGNRRSQGGQPVFRHPGRVRRRAAGRTETAGTRHRGHWTAIQDLVDPRRLTLDRHGSARCRRAEATRPWHDVRHRTRHLHPRGRAREPSQDA